LKRIIISLDFELRWGMLDRLQYNVDEYKENLVRVRENVPWILKIFKDRGISATWATVGAIACNSWEEFDKFKPSIMPSYKNIRMHYDNEFNRKIDPTGELYFAPDLIKQIVNSPRQELGLHTFGHIYGTEPEVTLTEFCADIEANKKIFQDKYGVDACALVYPRNQVIYHSKLIDMGLIKTFRGNEDNHIYSARSQREKKTINRARALIEAINPFISYANSIYSDPKNDIKSSSMLRIHMNSFLRRMHLRKLRSNIQNLRQNEYYHIWFHPHNLGNLKSIKSDFINFFDFVGNLIEKKYLRSENMETMRLCNNNPVDL